jgi:hypothetical protein
MKFNYVVTATPVGNTSTRISTSDCRSVEASNKEEFVEILMGEISSNLKEEFPNHRISIAANSTALPL